MIYILHMCGTSRQNQLATAYLIERGVDIEALDTCGYTPLHRMASNNLAIGARALISAGANPYALGNSKETPVDIARQSNAKAVLGLLLSAKRGTSTMHTCV